MRNIDVFAAAWFTVFSAAAFLTFGIDKWRASRSRRRVSEFSLALIGALGGWLGGFIGMQIFRHKTAKLSFKLKYAAAFIPFAGEVWAWWHWR